ncbi:MAG: baseplate J/gp47 family protein, partial [Anaerolineae bacterium]|nr:baseplate J/gp47 family protein [Anaerolineae bacterium]
VSRVTNLNRATGGRDQESMAELKERAKRELRAQQRAVTPEDYEDLAKAATRTVERVKCNIPQNSSGRLAPGVVEILVVPAVADALRAGDLSRLHLDEGLVHTIQEHLDKYRLLTTILHVREPDYVGVKAHVEIVPSEFVQPEIVKARIMETLNNFISPLNLAENPETLDEVMGANWSGWPFGRDLFIPEIFSLIQRIPGVKHVLEVKLSWRPVIPREELPPSSEVEPAEATEELTPVSKKVFKVRSNALLCSLNHEIVTVDLDQDEEA